MTWTLLEQKRAWARNLRERQRAAGICTACATGKAPRGSVCDRCRAKARGRIAMGKS